MARQPAKKSAGGPGPGRGAGPGSDGSRRSNGGSTVSPGSPRKPGARGQANRREALRMQQRRAERRKTLLVVGIAGLVGVGLVAAAAVPAIIKARNDPAKKAIADFGVSAAAASCDAVVTDPTTGSNVHVGPGTNQPEKVRIKYATVPPTSGEHYLEPATFGKKFYTAQDRPPMEQLVHNLEHGYTILWYRPTVSNEDKEALEGLSVRVPREEKITAGKFIVSAWDDSYGAFPSGKNFALSHWGAKVGSRQLCGKLSGAVVEQFVKNHPRTDAPEPDGV